MVSVIVPIYNYEKYITECIESLLRQTYKPLEIVLVDDGSTDSSGKICDHFSTYNPIVKIIHTTNQGRTRARITGVEHASGEYVAFVDADDYVAPTYVEHLTNCLFEQDVDISCCQSFNVSGEQKSLKTRTEIGRFNKKEIERILSNNFLFDERTSIASIAHYLCCKLFKKTVLIQVLPVGFDLWCGEDAVTCFSLFLQSDSIYVSEEPLYYYRQHECQTTKRMNRERWDANMDSFEALGKADNGKYLKNQLPLYILAQFRDWIKARFSASNTYSEFKSDMAYALNNETMEKNFMHKRIATTNKRHRILAFLAQHHLYYPYYIFLKAHLAVLRMKEKQDSSINNTLKKQQLTIISSIKS